MTYLVTCGVSNVILFQQDTTDWWKATTPKPASTFLLASNTLMRSRACLTEQQDRHHNKNVIIHKFAYQRQIVFCSKSKKS